jgi:hypothetical protein
MAVANCLTAGITQDCSTACCSGGVKNIWIAKLDDIDTVTRGAADEVTAITMTGGTGVFYKIVPLEFTSQFLQSGTLENNAFINDITLSFTIPCPNDDARQRIQEMINCCCGMAIVVELFNGIKWCVIAKTDAEEDLLFGKVKMRTPEFDSGTALSDPNQLVVTIGANAAKLAVPFTIAVPV